MRRCLFCSTKANSLEHAWPRWIIDQFKASKPCEAQLERREAKINVWHHHQPELTVRGVCQHCNNGWMSRLESQTKSVLQPLLMGESIVLDVSSQITIALWSLKTVMVLEALDQPRQRVYTQQEREQLRELSMIPWRSSVWLAKSVDSSFFMSSKNRHFPMKETDDISGVSITMALAHFVVQVLTIRVPPEVGPDTCVKTNVQRGPWDQATVQIFPTQSALASWPPPLGLDGEVGVNALAERFSTAMLDNNEVDSLIV